MYLICRGSTSRTWYLWYTKYYIIAIKYIQWYVSLVLLDCSGFVARTLLQNYFIVVALMAFAHSWHYIPIVNIGKRRFGPGRKLIYGVQRNLIIYIIEIIIYHYLCIIEYIYIFMAYFN